MNRRLVRAIALMVDRQPWTGPVVRRNPDVIRDQSVHLTWKCQGKHCGHWTANGAYLTGKCNWCGTPREVTS